MNIFRLLAALMAHLDKDQKYSVLNSLGQYELEKVAPLGRIGLIALATDFNSESDLRRMLPEGVDVFTNRVMNKNPLTLENLREMSMDLSRAAAGILPGFGVDAMIYGCTSGTIAIGAEKIQSFIHETCPEVPVTNPVTSVITALNHLEAKRISIITPYLGEININLKNYFESQGLEVLSLFGLGVDDDIDITKIPTDVIYDAAITHCHPDAEALFISCTALRASFVLQEIESKIGVPVVSSNQALVWHVLRLLNCSATVEGYGKLLR